MKILFVTTISNTVNAFLIPHIKILIEQGHQVDVAFNTVQEVSPELLNLGCKIHNFKFQRSPLNKENIIVFRKIKKLVKNERYDLIHTHTPVASFLIRLACRKIPKLKILYTAHGFHFFKGAPLKNWIIYYPLERLCSRWTDGVITMNNEDYKTAERMSKLSTSVFRVNGVGINLNKFFPETSEIKSQLRKNVGYKENDFIVIYAAELSYRKNQDLLIDAIYYLKEKIPNIKLLLVGEGKLFNKYQQKVFNLGLQENIEFLGFRKDVNRLMMLSDVAVSSSRQEGLPVNIMEAMATGLPLVVTNCRGNRDLVCHDENGYIVGINDKEELANGIEILYKSKELRKKFGEKSIELVEKYSIENVKKEYEQVYSYFLIQN